jgi:hypothetical protein
MTYNCSRPNLQASIIERDVPLEAILNGSVRVEASDILMLCTIPFRILFLELLNNGLYLIIETELKREETQVNIRVDRTANASVYLLRPSGCSWTIAFTTVTTGTLNVSLFSFSGGNNWMVNKKDR